MAPALAPAGTLTWTAPVAVAVERLEGGVERVQRRAEQHEREQRGEAAAAVARRAARGARRGGGRRRGGGGRRGRRGARAAIADTLRGGGGRCASLRLGLGPRARRRRTARRRAARARARARAPRAPAAARRRRRSRRAARRWGHRRRARRGVRRAPLPRRRAPPACVRRSTAPRPSVVCLSSASSSRCRGRPSSPGTTLRRADDRDHQALAVHVGALHGHGFDLPRGQLCQLLLLLLVHGAVVRRRPGGLAELVLLIADQFGKRRVELAELALQGQRGHRLGDVVEAVPRLALGRPGLLRAGAATGAGGCPSCPSWRPARAAGRRPR